MDLLSRESQLWTPLLEAPFFRDLAARMEVERPRDLRVDGLVEGSRALVLTLLGAQLGRGMLLVLPDDAALESYRRDLSAFAALSGRDPRRIVVFPAMDADPYDGIAAHPEVVRERVVALERLRFGKIDVLLVPVRALLGPLPSPHDWSSWARSIRSGDALAPDRFVLDAMGLGYRRVDTVSGPGEVSRRGGIVDIFPPTADEPVRIELFGDSVESLRSFDTDHQRSTGRLEQFVVSPAMESPPTEAGVRRVSNYLEQGLVDARGEDATVRQLREHLDMLQDQGYWPGFESLARLTSPSPVLLFDHGPDLLLIVDEPERTDEELVRAAHELQVAYEQSQNRILPPPDKLFADPAGIRDRLARPSLCLQELHDPEPHRVGGRHTIVSRSARAYEGRIPELIEDLKSARDEGNRTVCVMRATGSAERLVEIFAEYRLPANDLTTPSAPGVAPHLAGGLFVGVATLKSGFELPEIGLTVLTERGLFGEERKSAARKTTSRAAFISDFRDLKTGDLVVHVDHGLARYSGLGRPKGGSLNRDFMLLEFSGGDRLFVPADRLDLVQRYSGVAGHKPNLDRLGGPGWERVKSRVRQSVRSMAKELLQLYARRKAATGYPFGVDSPWQRELEDAFPFELTPDQRRALGETKADMESTRTMDRLLVGDVGFGKTEIALRAAFKAVMDGRQVALLTPTTVLALQHFETFKERFAPYPLRVEMVSRFRSPAEVRRVLEDLALGSVDVLIGTHRLLSKDVGFKQLGLLVVDEEQRFGVAHKERLKRMSIGIAVLSMTATPIPRTLQMSLAGVRDLSVIETPPPGRLAIQTYLVPFRKNVLAQALRQELRREGQAFVVHNRIETLPAITRAVEEMVPDARVVMAHGRMGEKALESVMLRFVEHQADILVTTTIIENGLDIPRANTMIVNRADRFGLAQLYQLRGRVGRSRQHAYAYFTVPSRHNLSHEARQRLRALQEFSELGAGFRLAAADLEIRGAGELLGSKQHGHIASLGFDLYCQMLERAVQEVKGEPLETRLPVSLNLGVDIKVPQSYLPDPGDRLVLYKRLAQTRDAAELDQLRAETEDRYGHLPQAAGNLFAMAHLRLVASNAGVKSVDLAESQLQIRFHERPPIDPSLLVELLARESGSLTPSGMLLLPAPPRGVDRIQAVRDLLIRMLGRQVA
jgi:transcription-repair coupling factor (superfamily II helicase)